MSRMVVCTLLFLVPASGAAAATPEQLASTPPTIASEGKPARHICFDSGRYDSGDGQMVPSEPMGCHRAFFPFDVRIGGGVQVGTPPEATAVAIRPRIGARRPTGRPSGCAAQGSGRWSCPVPSWRTGSYGTLLVAITYPGAQSRWTADMRLSRTATDRRQRVRFRLADEEMRVELLRRADGSPSPARRKVVGRRVRAVCVARSGRRVSRVTQEDRWSRGSSFFVFRFPRDLARRARSCLIESANGENIAVARLPKPS